MLFLLLLVLALSVCTSDACRQDWVQFEESCYGFGEETLSWSEAQEMCRTAGATLAEIESAAENTFLRSQATQKKGPGYWVGATDIFHEGTWVWLASGNLLGPFSDWPTDQPDNYGGHEDCLAFFGANYVWNDNICTAEQNFICEAPAGEAVVG